MNHGALLYRPEEVATLLRISRTKVYALIARGVLPVCRIDRSVRIVAKDLDVWIAARKEGGDVRVEEDD
jgi:excisionase family DNA binding protein